MLAALAIVAAVSARPARAAIILDSLVIRVYDNAGVPAAVRTVMLRRMRLKSSAGATWASPGWCVRLVDYPIWPDRVTVPQVPTSSSSA